ncbi:TRAP transporter substrate-binding protein [Parathalassolituus penaei]|uniref:TRAP transporter substrate-binding protein n=1 Tax=Parathalassolituus penaei TaxID=2997323 RepID=A0A9X3EG72_9GAMM|nr:TRAP transporter substrate-binding protein [Parathalassolituus penaei]MCY0966656.1 TRAP transporter substrate-binding protein [Parathalassolituus penaei]
MTKTAITRVSTLIASLLVFLVSATSSAESIRFGVVAPEGHPWIQVMQQFKSNLNTPTSPINVKESRFVKVRGEAAILEMLGSGELQAGIIAVESLTTFDPALNGWLVPFQFHKLDQLEAAAKSPEGQTMLTNLQNYNLVGLGYTFSGMRNIMSPKPLNSVEDLKGKRVRSFANDMFHNWYRRLGAEPKVIQVQDLVVNLQKNEIDAVDCDLATAVGMELDKAAPYLLHTNHMASPGIFVVSKKWWDVQSPQTQARITDAFSRAQTAGFELLAQSERDNLKTLRDRGVTVKEIPEAQFGDAPQKLRDFYYSTNLRIQQFGVAVQ